MDGRNKDLCRFKISGHQECFYPIATHIFMRNKEFDTEEKQIVLRNVPNTGS